MKGLRLRLVIGLVAAGIVFGAATVPQLYVSHALPGDAGRVVGTIVVDPPLTLTRDITGLSHLGIDPQYKYSFGTGFLTLSSASPVSPVVTQVELDTSYVMYRVLAGSARPVFGAACDRGTGGFYADRSVVMVCVANTAGDGFIWAGGILQTSEPPCSADAQNNVTCTSPPLSYPPQPPVTMAYLEAPHFVSPGVFSLLHLPASIPGCWKGDQMQIPGTDFTFEPGAILKSAVWPEITPADTPPVLCNYPW